MKEFYPYHHKDYEMRRESAKSVQKMNKGFSHCECCGWTWNKILGKIMMYADGHGCFPICIDCFDQLVLEEKYDEIISYYVKHFDSYEFDPLRSHLYKQSVVRSVSMEIGIDLIRDHKINQILK